MADVSQSTVNRWIRGRVRPGYDPVRKLAVAVYRRHPDLARELVEASGYAWAEPAEVPEPDPIPDEVLAVIKKNYTPDQQREIIAMLQELNGPRGEASLSDSDGEPRRAG